MEICLSLPTWRVHPYNSAKAQVLLIPFYRHKPLGAKVKGGRPEGGLNPAAAGWDLGLPPDGGALDPTGPRWTPLDPLQGPGLVTGP